MRYFKQEDFDKCMEFLAGKPDTVETQQGLYKFMHDECHMFPSYVNVTTKDLLVYSKVYNTCSTLIVADPVLCLKVDDKYSTTACLPPANWCNALSDGSQVVWNRKYQEFYRIEEIGMCKCNYTNYKDTFSEMNDIDEWLLESWCVWPFRCTQKQLVAIWNGKYCELFKNYWK